MRPVLADHEFEQVQFFLEQLEQVFLERAGLDEIVDAHRMLLAEAMEAADALLDFHRVPGQIEVDEAMAELEVAPLGAAMSEHAARRPGGGSPP